MRVTLEVFGFAISPLRRSIACFGISMPFSAMNMRTMRGFGPTES
jgi:hypothetical protein